MSPERAVSAYRQTIEALLALGAEFTEAEWEAPTECPEWCVKDVYAHLIGGEQWMAAGNPRPPDGPTEWAQQPVTARRQTPPAAVLAELTKVFQQRVEQLTTTPLDPEQPAYAMTGQPLPFGLLLHFRAFDAWVHEQDIRRAVGRPGNLATAGALITRDLLLRGLPKVVAKAAAAPPGSVVRLTSTDDVPFDVAVTVGQDGRGALAPATDQAATAHLTLTWEAFSRLSCGRGARTDYQVTIAGDHGLGEKVLASLSVTP